MGKVERQKPECLRCGQCCHWEGDDGKLVACPYLAKSPKPNRFFCLVYHDRLGRTLGHTKHGIVICMRRDEIDKNFDGCPYNVDARNNAS